MFRLLIVALALLASNEAGATPLREIMLRWTYPAVNADSMPLVDLAHICFRVKYQANGYTIDTAWFSAAGKAGKPDSIKFTLPPSINYYTISVFLADSAGNVSEEGNRVLR